MDTVVDVIPTGEIALPVKEDNSAPVDLLGRQEIVDRIMKILEVISEKRSSCTFALNGAWGTGKTFVLNMLMNQLWEYHSDKFIVFHYNCWQYDYYEEPLIAIVAAMLDSVDEENHLLPENLRDKAKAGMELAKPVLKKIATDFVKNRIGVDLTDVVSSVKDYQEALNTEEQKKAESRSFDEFYSFKKAIQQAQDEISKLTQKRTLIVVVDELDRCLPSYAIKVLERLHHLFAQISNSAVFLAIDKSQLDKTISQIFGNGTDTTKYLRKFVNFELQLDVGEIRSGFWEKHSDYFALFDEMLIQTDFPYKEFVSVLFSGIDMRTQERLMDRIKTAHMILFPDEKKDYSFMCGELMWAVFTEIYAGEVFLARQADSEKSVEYFISGSVHPKIYEFIRTTWVFQNPGYFDSWDGLKEAKRLSCFYFDGKKYIPGGSAIVPELLYYYLMTLRDNGNDHDTGFIFTPVPEYRHGDPFYEQYIDVRRFLVGGYESNPKDLYDLLPAIESFFSSRSEQNCYAIDGLKWIRSYGIDNAFDLHFFKTTLELLR